MFGKQEPDEGRFGLRGRPWAPGCSRDGREVGDLDGAAGGWPGWGGAWAEGMATGEVTETFLRVVLKGSRERTDDLKGQDAET